jgi:hypothetical protein
VHRRSRLLRQSARADITNDITNDLADDVTTDLAVTMLHRSLRNCTSCERCALEGMLGGEEREFIIRKFVRALP